MNNKATGYSLWLMPEGDEYTSLSSLIAHVCEQFEVQPFDPHVTLVGGILGNEKGIITQTKLIAQQITPYDINFDRIGYLPEHFKALFSTHRRSTRSDRGK